jgi:hypothetical protein
MNKTVSESKFMCLQLEVLKTVFDETVFNVPNK